MSPIAEWQSSICKKFNLIKYEKFEQALSAAGIFPSLCQWEHG
jgi:hypothetical protein